MVEEHAGEASPAGAVQTTPRRGKVQRGRAHARDIRIDTLAKNQIEAGEATFVLYQIASRTPNRLHQHPMRRTFIQRPADVRQRQRDDLGTAMVRCRPKQFLDDMLAGFVLEQPPGLSHIMICCHRVRLRARPALQEQALHRAILVIPRIAQRPTRSVHIGIGIGATIGQQSSDLQTIAERGIPQRSAPAQRRLLELFEQHTFIHIGAEIELAPLHEMVVTAHRA